MIDSDTYFSEGLHQLDELAVGEYGETLDSIMSSPDQALVLRRIGRLMSVWYKQPFAESFPYNPDIPTNWARAQRCWEIHNQPSSALIDNNKDCVEFLVLVSKELDRPVEVLFEFNIFMSLCKKLKSIVCDEVEVLKRAEKIAKELNKQGNNVSLITTNQVLGAAAVAFATYLVQNSSWLQGSHMPIVTGFTILAVSIGQNRLCNLITDFIESDDPKKDRFAKYEFPTCNSTDTRDRKPCRNRVVEEGLRCWIHIDK